MLHISEYLEILHILDQALVESSQEEHNNNHVAMNNNTTTNSQSSSALKALLTTSKQKLRNIHDNECEESLKCAVEQLENSILNLIKLVDSGQQQQQSSSRHLAAISDRNSAKFTRDDHPALNCPNNAKTESYSSSKSNDFVDSLQCNSKPGEFDSLDDLVGLDHVKQVLREALVLPEQSPQLFEAKLRAPWNLILLFGPPGTGKSSLVDALGAESKCSVLKITCADLLSSWFGESEKTIRKVFEYAKGLKKTCIVFIDEIDSVCRKRTNNEDEATRRIKTELLVQFDRIASHSGAKVSKVGQISNEINSLNDSSLSLSCPTENCSSFSSDQNSLDGRQVRGSRVVIICATNCYRELDPAFLRRFQQKVFVPLPNEMARKEFMIGMLSGCSETKSLLGDVDKLGRAVSMSEGMSCSNLKNIITEVSFIPIKELWNQTHWKFKDGKYWACKRDEANCDKPFSSLPKNMVYPRRIEWEDFFRCFEFKSTGHASFKSFVSKEE